MQTRSILPLLLLALVACSPANDASSAGATAMPAALKLEAAPAAAQGVLALHEQTDGAEVVVAGRVRDFVGTRAMFTIADLSLKSCADGGDTMECETPWDYCCEEPSGLARGTAAIEVHDGDKLVEGSVQGWNGLDHLKQVVVRGKLHKDAAGNLAVIANGIFVQP